MEQGFLVPKKTSINGLAGDSVVIIPVVQPGDSVVNTYIKATISDSVALEVHSANQYADLKFSNSDTISNEAENFAIRFMYLNSIVFNQSKFKITDKRLFHHSTKYTDTPNIERVVSIRSQHSGSFSSTGGSQMDNFFQQVCVDIVTTTTTYHCTHTGSCAGGICDQCNLCLTRTTSTNTICETWWEPDGSPDNPNPPGEGGGSGGGNGGGSTGCNFNIVASIIPPCDGGGGGWEPLPPDEDPLTLQQKLDLILKPGDSYVFQNVDPASPGFATVAQFQNYLNNIAHNITFDNSLPPDEINQTEKTEKARFNLNFISGVEANIKLTKNGAVWQLSGVTSSDWGVTFNWSWSQDHYDMNTGTSEIVIDLYGYCSYNIFVEGIGTVWKERMHFRIKVNSQTGKISSLSKL